MHENILIVLGLLISVFILVMLAQKIKVAYPIFLVLAGLGIGALPGIPKVKIDPDVIFVIFLPPLLYEAAWYTSWKSFLKWKRSIALLAFGLVFLTSTVVAYLSKAMIPGFTLAMGFLLGGIISPPDAVAATTVLKGLAVPKRTLAILEGESLVNDASSLIVFRFALAAVLTGSFSMAEAVTQFFVVAGMGVVVGLAGAHLIYAIHRFLPTTDAMDAALTVMTPYALFLMAEHFHFSGVMAVVSGGLFMSFRAHELFKRASSRMNMLGVWTTLIFVMNALVFVLIGLDLPEIVDSMGRPMILQGVKYGLIISAVAILLRIAWLYPVAHIPRWLSKRERKIASPGWKNPLIIGWAGMRGVVSLATALSIPVLTKVGGVPFPQRSLIIFITFIVILVTLVFQGLTLPLIVKWLKIKELDPIEPSYRQQAAIATILSEKGEKWLRDHYPDEIANNALVQNLSQNMSQNVEEHTQNLHSLESCTMRRQNVEQYSEILLGLHQVQRKELAKMLRKGKFDDAEIRKAEMQLDLDELKVTGNRYM